MLCVSSRIFARTTPYDRWLLLDSPPAVAIRCFRLVSMRRPNAKAHLISIKPVSELGRPVDPPSTHACIIPSVGFPWQSKALRCPYAPLCSSVGKSLDGYDVVFLFVVVVVLVANRFNLLASMWSSVCSDSCSVEFVRPHASMGFQASLCSSKFRSISISSGSAGPRTVR